MEVVLLCQGYICIHYLKLIDNLLLIYHAIYIILYTLYNDILREKDRIWGMKVQTNIFCYILIHDTDLILYQLNLEKNPLRYKEIFRVHRCKSLFFTFYPNAISFG